MHKKSQLTFDFSATTPQTNFQESDFIASKASENAINFLNKFFAQTTFDTTLPSCILKGEHACGKTHLLHIFAQKFHATFLTKNDFDKINSPTFFVANNFYILENIDEIESEELLLHIINSAAEAKSFLVLSAIDVDKFNLRDLTSRLKNIFTVEIKNPPQDLIKALLAKGLAQRQLKISDEVMEFLTNRLQPSYVTIANALQAIENHCHENKKNFTLLEAKKII